MDKWGRRHQGSDDIKEWDVSLGLKNSGSGVLT